ncbi:MAG: hypothetical protein ABUR63_01000, partial [Verrucomicrobiota bacterium]
MSSAIGVPSFPAGAPAAFRTPPAPRELAGPAFAVVLGDGTAAAPAPPPGAAGGIARSPVAAALARLADSQRSVDSLIDAAARGRTFTPAQLLALQATVSRDAQTVEVVSRVTDRVTGAV